VADDQPDVSQPGMRSRDQLALLAASCLLLSVTAGMLPDSVLPSAYRTAGWLVFALLALAVMYFAFPHMWAYGLWLAGIWGASVFGMQLILLGGERLFARYWAAAGIGLLMELGALFLVYTLLMRVRIARSVLESRGPLGLWLLAVVAFFVLCNLSGAGLALWSAGGSPAALGLYALSEALLALSAVYICWAPEEAVWSSAGKAPAPEAEEQMAEPAGGLLKKIGGRKEAPAPKACPACGAKLRAVRLKCPSCGAEAEVLWCAASESYVALCPACNAPTLTSEERCLKCGAPYPGPACPSCGKASPAREWRTGG
jgi:predicted RNA-binding Zn-ribbon protein involved in translation (DUF1610 family)